MQEAWDSVDRYFAEQLLPGDPVLEAALEESERAGLPSIQVAPNQAKLLYLLARLRGARRILEVGTLGGYSAIWMARALPPEGRLVTLEIDPKHAEVARKNLGRAGLSDRVEVLLGPASATLARLSAEGAGPFDLVFIDADKPGNPEYFARALELSREGTVIVVDNVVRDGTVLEAESADESVQGVRRLLELLANEPRVSATAIQTVGSKGYDGFAIAIVGERQTSREGRSA